MKNECDPEFTIEKNTIRNIGALYKEFIKRKKTKLVKIMVEV
jgi:hypothetical protein